MTTPLNYTDKQLIRWALLMWRNHIETGEVPLSSTDAANCKEHKKIKPLDSEQKALVVRLEKLAEKNS
jgi:hypothetical protein